MESQFNPWHGAVFFRNFDVGDAVYVRFRQSHDWKAASFVRRIGLYDVTLADGTARMFHANQMRQRSTLLTEHDSTTFVNTFNLSVRLPHAANGENGPLDEYAVDHNQEISIQVIPTADNSKSEQSNNAFFIPAVINEVAFQRNNFIWTQEGKRTIIHRSIPAVRVYFTSVFLKRGGVGI
jgi:hypothetical protein